MVRVVLGQLGDLCGHSRVVDLVLQDRHAIWEIISMYQSPVQVEHVRGLIVFDRDKLVVVRRLAFHTSKDGLRLRRLVYA